MKKGKMSSILYKNKKKREVNKPKARLKEEARIKEMEDRPIRVKRNGKLLPEK